jgi:hypothetical protein
METKLIQEKLTLQASNVTRNFQKMTVFSPWVPWWEAMAGRANLKGIAVEAVSDYGF